MISGYLVGGHVFLSIEANRFCLRQFVIGRALRILSAAYVVIVIVGVLFFNDKYLLPGIVKNFAFVQTYTSGGFMSHYWSLCVEIHFYAALPLAAYALRKWSAPRWIVAATIIGFILVRTALPFFVQGYLMKMVQTHWLLDFFAVGIFLAVRPLDLPRIVKHPATAAVAYVAAAAIVAIMAGSAVANVAEANWGLTLLLALASSSLIFVSAIHADFTKAGWFNRPVRAIATLSYSIYLVHLPIFDYSGLPIAQAIAATLAAAVTLHILVERPFLMIKRLSASILLPNDGANYHMRQGQRPLNKSTPRLPV